MGFKFEKPGSKGAKDQVVLTDHQREYRDREKREEERYKLAVDTGFWICFCFHDDGERSRFAEISGADEDGFCFGDRLRDEFESRVGVSRMRQFKPKVPKGERFPDPFAGLVQTDDLEADCFAEAQALLDAFEANSRRDRYENVWDSAYHIVAIFRDSNDVEEFIRDFALAKYGDLYMDGSAVLARIEKGTSA